MGSLTQFSFYPFSIVLKELRLNSLKKKIKKNNSFFSFSYEHYDYNYTLTSNFSDKKYIQICKKKIQYFLVGAINLQHCQKWSK